MNPTSLPILGAGESGIGAARLAMRHGMSPWVSDAGEVPSTRQHELDACGIPWEGNGHDVGHIIKAGKAAGFVIKSPGIPETASVVQALREADIEVISEIEFASRIAQLKSIHVVGITGANGKTTTASLIAAMLTDAHLQVACVGNIGTSWSRFLADEQETTPYHVVEISSFQLDGILSFRPDVAILLNITPDHLDRYDNNIEHYADAKWRIAAFQEESDVLILNTDDALTMNRWRRDKNTIRPKVVAVSNAQTPESITAQLNRDGLTAWGIAGIDQPKDPKTIIIHIPQQKSFTMTIQELALQGKHNLYNSMAASVAARVLELRSEGIRESLTKFDGIEHRMEYVSTVNEIRFINDSKATNVNSAWFALESVTGPVIWIAGGVDKGNDYTSLMHLVGSKVDHLICLGKKSSKIKTTFRDSVEAVHEVQNAEEAVRLAYDLGMPGHTVLLSPACASFDLFGSYEERGRAFKSAVRAL